MLDRHFILGVHLTNRVKHASQLQGVLTEFGCNIKTRIGLHDVSDGDCSPNGLLLLEIVGEETLCDAMAERLAAIEGVEVQQMVFDHP